MQRPYKDAVNYEECVEELRRSAGTQLDPEVVDAFCSIPRKTVLECGQGIIE